MRCSRCKLAQYCSLECQKQDFGDHKRFCKRIAGLQNQLEELAALFPVNNREGFLRSRTAFNYRDDLDAEIRDDADDKLALVQSFLVTKSQLADEILEMAFDSQIPLPQSAYLYKHVLYHAHEIYRLHPFHIGSMPKLMSLLAILGLDDECMSMAEFINFPHKHFRLPVDLQTHIPLIIRLCEESHDSDVFLFPMKRASNIFEDVDGLERFERFSKIFTLLIL